MRLGDLGSKSIALHGAALTLIVRIFGVRRTRLCACQARRSWARCRGAGL